MAHDVILALITTVISVIAGICGAAAFVAKQVSAIDRRFDRIEAGLVDIKHNQDLSKQNIHASLDSLNYRFETVLEYRINANTQLIGHKTSRIEKAISVLSQGVQKVSNGAYVPRGPDFWPTDNSPTQIKE